MGAALELRHTWPLGQPGPSHLARLPETSISDDMESIRDDWGWSYHPPVLMTQKKVKGQKPEVLADTKPQ